MDLALRIITAAIVVIVLFLYLYDSGARRLADIIMSAVVFIATLPIFAVLASISSLENVRVFERTDDDGLIFTYPKNRLNRLPFFMLVLVGKKNILPKRLFVIKKKNSI